MSIEQTRAHYEELARQAAGMSKPIDVRGVIATVIADLRASGDTGMVENLLDADVAIAAIFEAVKLGGEMPKKEGSASAGLFFTADNAARLRYAIVRAGGTP